TFPSAATQVHCTPSEPKRLIFVSSLNTTRFQSSVLQCGWAFANSYHAFFREEVNGRAFGLCCACQPASCNNLRTVSEETDISLAESCLLTLVVFLYSLAFIPRSIRRPRRMLVFLGRPPLQ